MSDAFVRELAAFLAMIGKPFGVVPESEFDDSGYIERPRAVANTNDAASLWGLLRYLAPIPASTNLVMIVYAPYWMNPSFYLLRVFVEEKRERRKSRRPAKGRRK